MAELMLKIKRVGEVSSFEDGDVIVAVNDRRIKDVHAQHICKPAGFNSDGLRADNSLAHKYLLEVRQYYFERVSNTEVRRTNLWTLEQEILGLTPNERGEHMDVALYLEKRIGHPKHLIFGTVGSESWFGGRTRATHEKLDKIWTHIESKTALKKNKHTLWPYSDHEMKQFLAVSVDDMDDDTEADLMSVEFNEDATVQKKRKHRVNWKDLIGKPPFSTNPTVEQVLDKNTTVEARDKGTFDKTNIIIKKSLNG